MPFYAKKSPRVYVRCKKAQHTYFLILLRKEKLPKMSRCLVFICMLTECIILFGSEQTGLFYWLFLSGWKVLVLLYSIACFFPSNPHYLRCYDMCLCLCCQVSSKQLLILLLLLCPFHRLFLVFILGFRLLHTTVLYRFCLFLNSTLFLFCFLGFIFSLVNL